jgi:hypothetical protein
VARIWYVDIPTYDAACRADQTYQAITTFKTKKEAVEFCKVEFGADNRGRVTLITEGEDGE